MESCSLSVLENTVNNFYKMSEGNRNNLYKKSKRKVEVNGATATTSNNMNNTKNEFEFFKKN